MASQIEIRNRNRNSRGHEGLGVERIKRSSIVTVTEGRRKAQVAVVISPLNDSGGYRDGRINVREKLVNIAPLS